MEAVSGFSIRLASTCFWLFLFSAGVAYGTCVCFWSPLSIAPVKLVAPFASWVFYGSSVLFFIYSLPPLLAQWWFCMPPKASSTTLLSKLARRMPGWKLGLWMRTPYQALKAVLLLAFSACCGWLFVQSFDELFLSQGTHEANLWFIGVPIGCAHAMVYLTSRIYLISYPIIHRKRWLRLKDKALSVLAMAATSWIYGMTMAAALFTLLPIPMVTIQQLWASVLASAVCCLIWAFSAVLTNIVLSERLFLTHYEGWNDYSLLAMLVERLTSAKEPIDEALTLQEMSIRSAYYGMRFWSDLFKEHMGTQLWRPLATHCLSQLDDLCKTLNLFMTTQHEATKDAKAVQWNSRGVASMGSLPGPTKEQLYVEDWLRWRAQACCWCASIVTDVACFSHANDTYGLLQMPPPGTPGFADTLTLLLHSYALLDRFMLCRSRTHQSKWLTWLPLKVGQTLGIVSAHRSSSTAGTHSETDALHDCILQCLHRLFQEFGSTAISAPARSKWAPPVTDKSLDLGSLASAICGG